MLHEQRQHACAQSSKEQQAALDNRAACEATCVQERAELGKSLEQKQHALAETEALSEAALRDIDEWHELKEQFGRDTRSAQKRLAALQRSEREAKGRIPQLREELLCLKAKVDAAESSRDLRVRET